MLYEEWGSYTRPVVLLNQHAIGLSWKVPSNVFAKRTGQYVHIYIYIYIYMYRLCMYNYICICIHNTF